MQTYGSFTKHFSSLCLSIIVLINCITPSGCSYALTLFHCAPEKCVSTQRGALVIIQQQPAVMRNEENMFAPTEFIF